MAIQRSNALRTALMNALNTQRGASCKIQIRTLAAGNTAGVGVLLAEFTGDAGGFGTVTNGVLTITPVSNATVVADGTAGHVEVLTSGDVFLESFEIAGDGFTISSTNLTTGQEVQLLSWTNTAAYPLSA